MLRAVQESRSVSRFHGRRWGGRSNFCLTHFTKKSPDFLWLLVTSVMNSKLRWDSFCFTKKIEMDKLHVNEILGVITIMGQGISMSWPCELRWVRWKEILSVGSSSSSQIWIGDTIPRKDPGMKELISFSFRINVPTLRPVVPCRKFTCVSDVPWERQVSEYIYIYTIYMYFIIIDRCIRDTTVDHMNKKLKNWRMWSVRFYIIYKIVGLFQHENTNCILRLILVVSYL